MKILNILRKIKKSFSAYRPSVEILIFQENLLHNLRAYQQKYSQLLLAPVLKSNAYGHGLIPVAQILDKEKTAFLVVDSLFEAMALRNEGIKASILIIGYTSAQNINANNLTEVAFTITSLEQLEEINQSLQTDKKFHLKIDTGMHRQGILPEEIESASKIIGQNNKINLEGICSHLADADNADKKFTQQQITVWEQAVASFKQKFPAIKFFHLAATAGAKYAGKFSGNVLRLGIGLYGIENGAGLNLKPALEMRSVVSSVKNIAAGASVGYNATFKADKEIQVATVPVGYFEGVDRRLSNKGYFKIKQTECQIVGKISMNITTLDITSTPGVKLGDMVVVISKDSQDQNSVEKIAEMTKAIPYEILIHLPQHLRRIIK